MAGAVLCSWRMESPEAVGGRHDFSDRCNGVDQASALAALIVVLRGTSPEQRAVLLLAIAAVIRVWRQAAGTPAG